MKSLRSKRRTLIVLATGVIVAGGVSLAALPSASGANYPAVPDQKTKQSLEFSASTIAATDNSAKDFPVSGQVVLTTEGQALDLEGAGGSVVTNQDQPVYMVQVTGDFVVNNVPTPPGIESPTGQSFYFLFNPQTGQATDFGVTSPVDLSKLGQVSEIELTPPTSASPSSSDQSPNPKA